MSETTKLLLMFFVGSGFGTTVVGLILKWRFDVRLESLKASLQRTSRVHERQVESLLTIHWKLEEGLFNLQRAASAAKFEGEVGNKEYLERMGRDLGAAADLFSRNGLLFRPELKARLDEFFKEITLAGVNLRLAGDPMVQDGEQRAGYWDRAREIAYREIPPVLEALKEEGRALIFGQP